MATTPKEFAKQLRKFAEYVEKQNLGWLSYWAVDEDPISVMHTLWDQMLDCAEFGSEGQHDPRGDCRG